MTQCNFIYKCNFYKAIIFFCPLSTEMFMLISYMLCFLQKQKLATMATVLLVITWKEQICNQELKEKEPSNVEDFTQIPLAVFPLTLDCHLHFLSLRALHRWMCSSCQWHVCSKLYRRKASSWSEPLTPSTLTLRQAPLNTFHLKTRWDELLLECLSLPLVKKH